MASEPGSVLFIWDPFSELQVEEFRCEKKGKVFLQTSLDRNPSSSWGRNVHVPKFGLGGHLLGVGIVGFGFEMRLWEVKDILNL